MYNFDKLINRLNTNSLKWDVKENELPMWVADMDFMTAPEIIEALAHRVEHGIFGYTIIPDQWYDAIISWWERRHQFHIEKNWLQFCTGVVPAISCIVKRITNIGDNVVVLTPAYNIFFNSIENSGRHVLECPLTYNNEKYSIDYDTLEKALANPLTTMLIFCNPHNPTGNIWTKEEILKIGALCKKNNVIVLSDEIHCDLISPGYSYTPFASVSEECMNNSITCISASKAFNIAGLQSSSVLIPNQSIRDKIIRGLNSDEVAEPNCFAIEATITAFNHGEKWLIELLEYINQNRKIVKNIIKNNIPEISIVDSNATYLMWLDCSKITNDSDELCEFIREKTGLILSSGKQFRGNGYKFLRLNIACNKLQLEDGLSRFIEGIREYKKQR